MRPASRAALCLALALALAACESTPQACPGEALATLRFAQSGAAGSTCAFAAAPAGVEFTGTITRLDGGDVGLCLQRALGRVKRGTLALDVLSVSDAESGQRVGACPCKLDLVERLQGTVHRNARGEIDGFSGELSDELVLAPDRAADRQPAACLDGSAAGCAPLVRPAPEVAADRCAVRVPIAGAP